MRRTFQDELRDLHIQFYQMGLCVREAVQKSVYSYVNREAEAAKEVIDQDAEINEMEIALETSCIELIALQQPVSSDLRQIIAVMKASADLERIGDHAVSISKAAIRVIEEEKQIEIEQLLEIVGNQVILMLQGVLEAYSRTEEKRAIDIALKDSEIDRLTNQIHVLVRTEMENDPQMSLVASSNMMVAGYLERIGDYVTNLSEWIVYAATGEMTDLNSHMSDRK